jgi:hypothetical protein
MPLKYKSTKIGCVDFKPLQKILDELQSGITMLSLCPCLGLPRSSLSGCAAKVLYALLILPMTFPFHPNNTK